MKRHLREHEEALVFAFLTVALTLLSAAICVPLAARLDPGDNPMLRASILYVAVVGWQPLVALAITRRQALHRRSYDDGIRPVSARDSLFAIVLAATLLGAAVVIDAATTRHAPSGASVSGAALARLSVGFAAIVAILYVQAVVEELAWRSYVLPRLMRALGAWPGLLVHGLLWGLSYAPLFAIAGGGVQQALAYVVTAGLLGAVLGWVRLARRSIFASAASNATLTLCAGLPLVLVGETSRMSAAFEAPGWLPLALVVGTIAWHRPWRTAISVPWRRTPEHVN